MKHVLLVEDDLWLQDMYSRPVSELSGVTTHVASSASEALERLDSQDIDLIILDMFLQDHNGMELLHEIASYDDTRNIPVIVLSAVHKHDFAMSPKRWRQYNVIDHLYKPDVKPVDLSAIVTKHLVKSGAAA